MDLDKTEIQEAGAAAPSMARRSRTRAGKRTDSVAAVVDGDDDKDETILHRLARWSYWLVGIFTGNVVYAVSHHDLVMAILGGAFWPLAWAWMLITRSVDVSLLRESVAWFFR